MRWDNNNNNNNNNYYYYLQLGFHPVAGCSTHRVCGVKYKYIQPFSFGRKTGRKNFHIVDLGIENSIILKFVSHK
jgi:hypothetical protein